MGSVAKKNGMPRLALSIQLQDLLNIDNIHFKQMIHTELKLNKAITSDTFFDLYLSYNYNTVSTKIYEGHLESS